MKDIFSIEINSSPEAIFPFLSIKEKMINWVYTDHAIFKFSYDGSVEEGDQLIIIPEIPFSIFREAWTFIAECSKCIENKQVDWTFIKGPIRGIESLVITSKDNSCLMQKVLCYKGNGLLKTIIWQLFGRWIHAIGCKKELRKLRLLVEKSVE